VPLPHRLDALEHHDGHAHHDRDDQGDVERLPGARVGLEHHRVQPVAPRRGVHGARLGIGRGVRRIRQGGRGTVRRG
jgi:hypothetical protein